MSDDEREAFLADQRVVSVASHGHNGWPHLVPLWYVVRDGELWIYTYGSSQKVKNLERDDHATLLIEDGREYTELRGVMIEATAHIEREFDRVLELAEELTLRYADGLESIDADAREGLKTQARKRVAIRFEARRTVSWDHRKLGGTY
ncbi:MAG: pyridoxamine 5'-phosphate oxidase family protein [Solirubrobacterales bacterium]